MFGIDPTQIQKNISLAYQSQPNQYSSGSASTPDNTSWMQPSGSGDSTLATAQDSRTINGSGFNWANTGISGMGSNPNQQQQPQQPIQPGNGTAIDAVNNGWMMPSQSWGDGFGWHGFDDPGYRNRMPPWAQDWNTKNQQPQSPGQTQPSNPNAPTYGSYQPHAGWDTSKLQDPNKHDPKYDWLRAVQSVGGNKDMNAVVDYYNKNFGSNGPAKFLGGDLVDFGGGVGPVDVLFDQEGKREDLWAPQWANSTFNGPSGAPSTAPSPTNTGNVMNPNLQAMMQFLQQRAQRGKLMRTRQGARITPYGQPQ